MSMCTCASSSCAWRSSGRSLAAASSRPRSGASGRNSGVSAETLTDTFARGTGPAESCWSTGRSGQRRAAVASCPQRRVASLRVAVGLGGGDRRLAEQVDRAGHAPLPQVAEHPERRRGGLADDEPVSHVPHAAERRRRPAQCAPPGCRRSSSPPRSATARRGPPPGTPAGGGRGRRASGTPAPRRRTGTAPPAVRDRRRRAPSPASRSPARDGGRWTGTPPRARGRSGGSRVRPARAPGRPPTRSPQPGLRAGGGGVAASIVSQLMSRARSSSSTLPPPRSPNSRLAYSR